MGRLHTRYSPVRRFRPEGLSLDLHVLGLSLAFILSQDQTLRCISFIIYLPLRVNRQFSEIRPILAINSVIDGKAFTALSVVRYSASLTCAVALALPKYVLAKFIVNFNTSKIVAYTSNSRSSV